MSGRSRTKSRSLSFAPVNEKYLRITIADGIRINISIAAA